MQEAELEKAKGLLSRFKNDHMSKLLDLLDIPRSELKDKVGCLAFPLSQLPAAFLHLRSFKLEEQCCYVSTGSCSTDQWYTYSRIQQWTAVLGRCNQTRMYLYTTYVWVQLTNSC